MHFFPHPFRKAHRHLALLVAAAPMASLAQETVTDVYFVQNRQFVSEQDGTLDVTVELSQVAFAEVVVPFRIADASTATRGSEDDESGDYFIAEDSSENDGNGILFDPATGTGSFTFQSGVRRLSLPVRLRDDTLDSSDENEALEETIRFEMDTDGVTIARPVVPTTHTIVIQDNDTVDARFPYHAYFESTYFRVDEGDEVTIPVRLRGPGGVSRTLRWEYHFGSGEGQASSSDVNIGDDPSGTVGGSARTFDIVVDTAGDLEEEPDETFQLSLAALFETDAPDNTYVIDEDERATILIVDNDPSEVFLDVSFYEESLREERPILEGRSVTLFFRIDSSIDRAITIPLNLGGDAVFAAGETEDFDYTMPDANIDEETGEVSVTIRPDTIGSAINLITRANAEQDGDREIVIELGQPYYEVGEGSDLQRIDVPLTEGDLAEGRLASYQLTILDDDPMSLAFGQRNPAIEEDGDVAADPFYLPATELVVAESDVSVSVPIFLTGAPAENVRFEMKIVGGEATTASLPDPDLPLSEQDWDFFIDGVNVFATEETFERGISTTNSSGFATSVTLRLNDDRGDPLPIDALEAYRAGTLEGYEGVERDETITLEITAITTEDSGAQINSEASRFTITVRELPDLDLSAYYPSFEVDRSNWVDGAPPRNPHTNLHEVRLDMTAPAALVERLEALNQPVDGAVSEEDTLLAGYRSFKLVARPYLFDPEDATGGDVLEDVRISGDQTTPHNPNGITPYSRLVSPPFTLRYPTGRQTVTLVEGTEPTDPLVFDESNADIVAFEPYILAPVEAYDVNPDPLVGGGQSGPGYLPFDTSMDFLIEYRNGGRPDFDDLDRILRPEAFAFYLSPTAFNPPTPSGLDGEILAMHQLDDGDVLIEISNPFNPELDGPANIVIEYLNADGAWRAAQPGVINSTGTVFRWIDSGPPKTYPAPQEVQLRLYRISNN